jgi:hypothetical protein
MSGRKSRVERMSGRPMLVATLGSVASVIVARACNTLCRTLMPRASRDRRALPASVQTCEHRARGEGIADVSWLPPDDLPVERRIGVRLPGTDCRLVAKL